MNPLPPSTFHLPPQRSRSPISHLRSSLSQTLGLLVLIGLAPIATPEPSLGETSPSHGRLTLAQSSPGSAAAVSSQAVATQPNIPLRANENLPPRPPAPTPTPATPPSAERRVLDPRLDPNRPKDSQLSVASEQTLTCGGIPVVLPAGTYKQKLIVENPTGKRAIGETDLQPQQVGLGYIRYLSDIPLKIDGVERTGGLDIPVRPEDNLPVRIWYRKMEKPDTITKVFTFILPPVALVSGLGAWSSGNVLIPDSPPKFSEARDYYLKPLKPKPSLDEIPQPSHVRPLSDPYATPSSQIRSK